MDEKTIKYSIIIPVYNRPDEVAELLQSVAEIPANLSAPSFEILIVEDGSSLPCREVVERYAEILPVRYFAKPNSGPGQTRNYGAERASGEWLLILDSDVLLPKEYLMAVDRFLMAHPEVDAFGGPDMAHESFSPVQKAINYSMTSFFTTGGIRGGKKKLDKFYPRSFNMGIRAEVYRRLGGFRAMRFGEDVDFSYRMVEAGYRTALIENAGVFHKRRTDLKKFFKQVHNSGIARVNLTILHPGSLKLVHLLPAAFTIGVIVLLLGGLVWPFAWTLLLLYALLVCVDSTCQNRSLKIGLLSVAAAFVQLCGYGSGFLSAAWNRWVLRRENKDAFVANFYRCFYVPVAVSFLL